MFVWWINIVSNNTSKFIQSYHDKELVVINLNEFQDSIEYTNFNDNILNVGETITYSTIPFEIQVRNYCINSKLYALNNKNELDSCVVKELEEAIKYDYSQYFCSDGFFWGQQFQEQSVKEYKKQDKEFLKEAKQAIKDGQPLEYECWW